MSGIERSWRRLLLLLIVAHLAACNSVHASSDGAPSPVDSVADDAGPHAGPVTVTALDPQGNGLPLRGSHVFFHNPDGALVADDVVIDDATVSANLLPGGSVTVFWPISGLEYRLETVLDVAPGDNLVLTFLTGQMAPVSTMHLAFPPAAAATTYDIFTPYQPPQVYVSSTSTDVTATPAQSAVAGDYFAMARSNGQPIGFIEGDQIPFAPGSTVTLSGPWQSFDNCSVTYDDVPGGVTIGSMRSASSSLGLRTLFQATGPTNGTTVVFGGACAVTVAPAMLSTTVTQPSASPAVQVIHESMTADELAHSTDVSALLLPWLALPSFDLADGIVQTQATGTAPIDAYMVEVTYQRPLAPLYARNYDWIVIGPRIEDVTLPALPTNLALLPSTADGAPSARATAFEWSAVPDYAAFKRRLESLIADPIKADPSAPLTRSSASGLAF